MMHRHGEADMGGWWIPIGLAIWFAVATAVALWLGPVLGSCTQAREALDQHTAKILALPQRPAKHWRHAS